MWNAAREKFELLQLVGSWKALHWLHIAYSRNLVRNTGREAFRIVPLSIRDLAGFSMKSFVELSLVHFPLEKHSKWDL